MGREIDLPYTIRTFKTQPNYPSPDPTATFDHGNIGDVRVKGNLFRFFG